MSALLVILIRRSRTVVLLAALAGALSGAGTIGVIAVLQQALAEPEGTNWALIAVFTAAALTVLLAGAGSAALLIRLAQRTIHNLRLELCNRILDTGLRRAERIGVGRLLAALTDDVMVITAAVQSLPLLFINGAIVVGALVYVAVLSLTGFMVLMAALAAGVILYRLPMRRANMHLRRARQHQDELHQHLEGITRGVKELKLNGRRREQLVNRGLLPAGDRMANATVRGVTLHTIAGSWGQLLFLATIGAMLFVGPSLGVSQADLAGFTLAVLYLNTPLVTVLNTVPVLSRAGVAMQTIRTLELGDEPVPERSATTQAHTPELRLEEIAFSYEPVDGEPAFHVGPVSISFQPGTITCIVGGNGSGKTTLAKLLSGLYRPSSGRIVLDTLEIDETNVDVLRAQIAAVFSDVHLFAELDHFGEDPENVRRGDREANQALGRLAMGAKAHVADGRFSTLALSTGQRKRLALASAISGQRRVLLFDEWAADQDPEFREYFYLELLPALRDSGKTVIAITHDDRYFGVANQILKLDHGVVAEVVKPGSEQMSAPALSDKTSEAGGENQKAR